MIIVVYMDTFFMPNIDFFSILILCFCDCHALLHTLLDY